MKQIILLKLGGSLITDKTKPFTARKEVIRMISREISDALKQKPTSLIIGSGGGSFPHTPARKYGLHKGLHKKNSRLGFALVADAAARLNRLVVEGLIEAGINAVSFSPSSTLFSRNGQIREFYLGSFKKLLEIGLVPVVHGDIVFDEEKGCAIISTEKLLNYIARELKKNGFAVKKVIYAGIKPGVLNLKSELITHISSENFVSIKKELRGSEGIDVTGGMSHKVEEALKLSEEKIPVTIINGLIPGNIKNAILGSKVEGTLIG